MNNTKYTVCLPQHWSPCERSRAHWTHHSYAYDATVHTQHTSHSPQCNFLLILYASAAEWLLCSHSSCFVSTELPKFALNTSCRGVMHLYAGTECIIGSVVCRLAVSGGYPRRRSVAARRQQRLLLLYIIRSVCAIFLCPAVRSSGCHACVICLLSVSARLICDVDVSSWPRLRRWLMISTTMSFITSACL